MDFEQMMMNWWVSVSWISSLAISWHFSLPPSLLALYSSHIDCLQSWDVAGRLADVHYRWRRQHMGPHIWLCQPKNLSWTDLAHSSFPTEDSRCRSYRPIMENDACAYEDDEYVMLIEWWWVSLHASVICEGTMSEIKIHEKFNIKDAVDAATITCEWDTWAMIATWHVKGAKQSLSKGVRGCSRFGGCFCPLKIDNTTLPTPESGRPPLRFAHPPKSMRCKRLRPPATVRG